MTSPWRRDRYLLIVCGADDLAGSDAALDFGLDFRRGGWGGQFGQGVHAQTGQM